MPPLDSSPPLALPEALIIPFPRAARPPAATGADEQQARLRLANALAALEMALAAQRKAVARWQTSLATLKGNVQGLGTSLAGYDTRLRTLGARVGALNTEARRLEGWADGVLARKEHAGH